MYIERVQIEEGFLNGLDITLTSGLNVIIGARGTGKTSLIELIRYCLDVTSNTAEMSRRSREHALSILGSGQVTVTLVSNGQRIHVTRTASDAVPRANGFYTKPIIFSQTEIETVGLEAVGRLRLIDSFLPSTVVESAEEKQVVANIASLTAEVSKNRKDIEELEKILNEGPVIAKELAQIAEMEVSVAQTSNVLNEKTTQLHALSQQLSISAVNEAQIARLKEKISGWNNAIKLAREFFVPDDADSQGVLQASISQISIVHEQLTQAQQNTYTIWHSLDEQGTAISTQRLSTESTARGLRQEVEALQAGAGQIMRKGQELRERKAKLDSLTQVLQTKKNALDALTQRRGQALDQLEHLRASRHQDREKNVSLLNVVLKPSIKIGLIRNGQQANFLSVVTELLRGSNLKYGDIAPALSASISPRVLLEAVDRFDFDLIAVATGISVERASRLLSHLRTCDLGNLGTIDLEDEVTLQLLDGTDYKELSSLSTGQRCTVILPLVLAHRERVLVVDQPEDHIDNAFIAGTLIKSVLGRDPTSQILFSTHNPNIPVLGNADRVVHLGSDGKRGYVICEGSLNDDDIVRAISTVMEGGAEAFSRRSSFYNQFNLT